MKSITDNPGSGREIANEIMDYIGKFFDTPENKKYTGEIDLSLLKNMLARNIQKRIQENLVNVYGEKANVVMNKAHAKCKEIENDQTKIKKSLTKIAIIQDLVLAIKKTKPELL